MFRLSRNERSHWSGNGVHVEPESVFMIGRNMHLKEKGLNITAKNIADELLARASKCSPGYWRKLRCALVYHQQLLNFPDAAERIQTLSRPDIPVKAKQKRVKKVDNDDLVALIQYFKARNDSAMLAAILLFMRAGIRPAELATLNHPLI
ncbi:hypothetical protein ACEUA0_20595 [Aeromonas veronii]